MVHKSSLIPGFSKFIDENILAHYPATSMKRILMAGAASLYLKQGSTLIDKLMSNPMFSSLGVMDSSGMIDIDSIKDTIKQEVNKAGCVKLVLPLIGEIDFTTEDVDSLYRHIKSVDSNTVTSSQTLNNASINGGIY